MSAMINSPSRPRADQKKTGDEEEILS